MEIEPSMNREYMNSILPSTKCGLPTDAMQPVSLLKGNRTGTPFRTIAVGYSSPKAFLISSVFTGLTYYTAGLNYRALQLKV